MIIRCERCNSKMVHDGDNDYYCPECGAIAYVDEYGIVSFDEESLVEETVGEVCYCPECGTKMFGTEDGYECPECGCSIVND